MLYKWSSQQSLLTGHFHFPFVVSRFWAMELWAHMDPGLVWGPTPGDSKCLGWRRFLGGITDLLTAGAFWKNKIRKKLAPSDITRAFQNQPHPTNSSAVQRAQMLRSNSARTDLGINTSSYLQKPQNKKLLPHHHPSPLFLIRLLF